MDEKVSLLIAAKLLESEFEASRDLLKVQLCTGIERHMSNYFSQVKLKVMKTFESQVDELLESSKKQMVTDFECNARAFKFNGTMPKL